MMEAFIEVEAALRLAVAEVRKVPLSVLATVSYERL
jgi:hypothetical protein